MKKKVLISLAVILVISLFVVDKTLVGLVFGDPNTVADHTFKKLITAIEHDDKWAIRRMFSVTARMESDLSIKHVEELLDFIEGDIVNYSDASDHCVTTSYDHEFGWERMRLWSAFTIETTEQTYHISIIEYRRDDFNFFNIGLSSVCIINAQDWTEDAVFRGGGDKTPGIHILD
jgi:hypothetical protein